MNSLKHHWPEYFIEAAGLSLFMISACSFGVVLEYPGSPVHQAVSDPFFRSSFYGAGGALMAGCPAAALLARDVEGTGSRAHTRLCVRAGLYELEGRQARGS